MHNIELHSDLQGLLALYDSMRKANEGVEGLLCIPKCHEQVGREQRGKTQSHVGNHLEG
jgi:hypothetical protein